jgi:hypothetical protein
MPVLRNPKHERFAQARASGKTYSAAYREAVSAKSKNPDVLASQLASQPGVRERIEELKEQTANKCSMSREEFLESLVAMYQGKPGEAGLDNPLCDSLISRGVRHGVFPMKTAVANQIAKLCGWDAPVKVEVEAGSELTSLLGRLFTAGGTLSNSGNGDNGERSAQASGSASTRH